MLSGIHCKSFYFRDEHALNDYIQNSAMQSQVEAGIADGILLVDHNV